MPNTAYELVGNDKRKYPINSAGLTFGSDSANDVIIRDSQVSSTHARLIYSSERLWVRDENTKAGTYINGQRIAGQQELQVGDKLKIGSFSFQLKKIIISTVVLNHSRKGTVLVGISTATLFILILLLGSSGLFRPGLVLLPTATISPSPAMSSTPLIMSSPTVSPSSMVTKPDPTSSPTPNFIASIACPNLDQYKDIHTCLVTNLGTVRDTLWLSFTPHRLENTNYFNLSIILEGEGSISFPDRKGKFSLGNFEPGMKKNILLQMICVDTLLGCPLTTIQVQLLANNGNYLISSMEGIFSIKNIAIGKTATPTVATKATLPTELPTASTPTQTNTPSDAYGPTATSNP